MSFSKKFDKIMNDYRLLSKISKHLVIEINRIATETTDNKSRSLIYKLLDEIEVMLNEKSN